MASANPLVEKFRKGEVPAPLRGAAARGALPLPPEDLLEILFHLRTDAELRQDVAKTMSTMPLETILPTASAADASPEMLDFVARACFSKPQVVEKVILNPATADATIQVLSQHVDDSMLDLISLNQVRLARAPGILQAMLANTRLSVTTRRRLKEVWELHQAEVARTSARPVAAPAPEGAEPAAPAASEAPAPVAATADTDASAELAERGEDAAVPTEGLEDLGEAGMEQRILEELQAEQASEEDLRLAQKILRMNVPEKVQLAAFGPREARAILIRDGSRQVQEAVINSPKITDNEVEKITNMRSISEDVLRLIASSRDHTRSYSVIHNLVRNPKTPQPIALSLMSRLQNRDLGFITKDKNIPDVVRRHALITLQKRTPAEKKK